MYLQHFGVKGMKWGHHKVEDEINSRSRTIRKGTEIQNISSREFRLGSRHMYSAYTPYDKAMYTDMMGNFMYNERGYKNTFVVKKDIKLPSDRQLVEAFTKVAKDNPKQVSKDLSKAYNELHLFSVKSAKHYNKQISKISEKDLATGEKLAKEYISLMVSNKTQASRATFFGELIKRGFDAMSDVNDRDGLMQDPLIIFNPPKTLGDVKSVKLTKKDLENYSKLTGTSEFSKTRKDYSKIQR